MYVKSNDYNYTDQKENDKLIIKELMNIKNI